MRPQSAKAKGRNLQKWVRDLILRTFPSLSANDVRSTSMGASGTDILLSEAALKMVPLSIECKSRGAIAVYAFMEQATENLLPDTEPVVILKQNHGKPLALCDAEWLFNLLSKTAKG